MKDNEKEIIIKFFELKAKQLICKLWLATHQKPGYVQAELGLMSEVLKVQSKLDNVEEELLDLLKANEELFTNTDLEALANEQEFKVSIKKQEGFSKELLGYETTIEDLFEKLEKRSY